MKRLLLIAAAAALDLASAHAATLEFDDGRRYTAEITGENRLVYDAFIDGMRVQLPKSRVRQVDDNGAPGLRPDEAGLRPVTPATGAPVVVRGFAASPAAPAVTPAENGRTDAGEPVVYAPTPEGTGAAQPLMVRYPLPEDPSEIQTLREWVESLAHTGPSFQANAADALHRMGDTGLAALATYGLYHPRPSVRTASADLLARSGGPRVLKALIEAFHAAAQPTIPPYQVAYVQTLARHISILTGEDFTFYVRSSRAGPAMADRMVEWWNANFDRLPAQLGEPPLNFADPNHVAALRTLRSLNLQPVAFDGEILPPEILNPPPAERTNQDVFLDTFTLVPRNSALVRPIDRVYGDIPRSY